MRKGADSFGRPTSGHASRGVRYPRRRDAVWLVTGAAPELNAMNGQPHHTAGALALDSASDKPEFGAAVRRCALIVEQNSVLAQTLARALQARFAPEWSVRCISDGRALAKSPQNDAPGIIVVDASWPSDNGVESHQRLTELSDLCDTQMIFVTPNTSYQLSQRGVMSGIVLREWRQLDDIVALVAEALADTESRV